MTVPTNGDATARLPLNGRVARGNLRVLYGPLVGQEKRIRRIDQSESMAYVRVGLPSTGEGFTIALPLEVTAKNTTESAKNKVIPEGPYSETLARIPLDPEASQEMPSWYLVACTAGREEELCRELREKTPLDLCKDAFVPILDRHKKFHGVWETRQAALWPGLFVVETSDVRKLAARLERAMPGCAVVRASGRRLIPIAREARLFLEEVMDDERVLRLSWSEIVNDELRVSKGPLVGLEQRIVSYNRRKSYAMVRLCEGDDDHLIEMSLAIMARR